MPMTLSERILAAHCGEAEVQPGQFISARVDFALANDITAPLAIKAFHEMGARRVFDPERVALVLDHYVPAKDVASAAQSKVVRDFAHEQGITHFYDVGRGGVEHALLPEKGLVVPGDVVIGADSHTCTYGALGCFSTGVGSTDLAAVLALGECWLMVPESIKFVLTGKPGPWVCGKDVILHLIGKIGVSGARYQAMEFVGEGVAHLTMSDRLTMANMAIEAGGKNGVFPVDEVTREYLDGRAQREWRECAADPGAAYAAEHRIDLRALELQVALPHLPENSVPVSQVGEVPIDQVFIGSCTNGALDDLRVAARVLKGRKVHPGVRLIVIPATTTVFSQGVAEGIAETVTAAGGAYSTPTCGPCLGGHMGVLAAGERCVATSNRNFKGRMGDPASEVYLTGPAVAAASAVAGRIVHPDNVA